MNPRLAMKTVIQGARTGLRIGAFHCAYCTINTISSLCPRIWDFSGMLGINLQVLQGVSAHTHTHNNGHRSIQKL